MKTFKQKSLYAALAGVTALGVTSAAQAVNVNPDGLGQVLIYPYYTVRNSAVGSPFSSLLTVVNSQASAKAVKVRFIEGKNSQEVLDFNLYLSSHDVWTAAILPTSDGGAGVGTFDKSCTVPIVSNSAASPTEFVNVLLDDAVGDFGSGKGDDSLDRTREGYAEVIEMGTLVTGSPTQIAITHVNGVPAAYSTAANGCVSAALSDAAVTSAIAAPTDGLYGDMTLISVNSGVDYTSDAVALDNFRNTGQYQPPGSILPDLTQVSPAIAVVMNGNSVYQSTFGAAPPSQAVDAISALFMHDHVYNTFILDSGTSSSTDWVLTFPTKRYYYDANGIVQYLFQRNAGIAGACDDIGATLYDREENTAIPQVGFSPPRPGKTNQLCWEANVLTFNGSQALGSTNNRSLTTTYQNGWADLNFTLPAGTLGDTGSLAHVLVPNSNQTTTIGGGTAPQTISYFGLPVIGFAVETYSNHVAGVTLLGNYGGTFVHKGTRSIR